MEDSKTQFGQKLGQALLQTTGGLKEAVSILKEFRETYAQEMKGIIENPESTPEQIRHAQTELAEINSAGIPQAERAIEGIDKVMDGLREAMLKAFKIKH